MQLSVDVTAVFWPQDNIRQSLVTDHSVCVIDQNNHLQCWGASAARFMADGAVRLVSESIGTKNNLCVLYADNLRCRNEGYNREWVMPSFILQPIDAVLAMQSLCVLHGTESGNAVYCATNYGEEAEPVPALSNPTDLYVNPNNMMCVTDQGQPVCW